MSRDSTIFEVNGKKVRVLEQHKMNFKHTTGKQQVFIIGSKGIPAAYGGFETFIEKLTEYQVSDKIHYHVAKFGTDNIRYEYNGAECFGINVPNIGPGKAVYYDIVALKYCIKYCKQQPAIEHPIFYVLACRIGPFIGHYKKKIEELGGILYVNPDGHEWKRAKWSVPIRKYWKISERLMVKHADLLVCDSVNIEKYIRHDYSRYYPKTTFIAYGADMTTSILTDADEKYTGWLNENGLSSKGYYLVVGRFVPENNFETMMREFMKSKSKRDFVIITTANATFREELEKRLHFRRDKRIKFVGTVYNQELLKKIRENAYGYFHGHEVGGTNPSLLEAMSSTNLNLLIDVGFNKEVGEDAAIYWNKQVGNLAALIDKVDQMSKDEINALGEKAKKRVAEAYNWKSIVNKYEKIFLQVVK